MASEKSAGAVVYRVTGDGNLVYLLLQPSRGKPWGFPKGKIDAGETEEEAARREIAEEAGLMPVDLDPTFRHVVHYVYRRGRSLIRKEVVYFLARTSVSDVHLSFEHVASRWADLDAALDLVVFENARAILRKADDFLQRQFQLQLGG
ncbi:MAG TPA: NUDIX domain-containing protein [Armatimonadota bacterium]|jgi:8-oxo-dGTP pyrophosphatase MutT (NUDIX family)